MSRRGKAQERDREKEGVREAVSYTHLDVYKRQAYPYLEKESDYY